MTETYGTPHLFLYFFSYSYEIRYIEYAQEEAHFDEMGESFSTSDFIENDNF